MGNNRKVLRIVNMILAVVVVVAAALLIVRLLTMNVLPDAYTALVGVVMLFWLAVVTVVCRHSGFKSAIASIVISVLLTALLCYANFMLYQLDQAMQAIVVTEEAEESADAAESADAEEAVAEVEEEEEEAEEPITLSEEESVFIVYISGIDDTGDIDETVSRSDVNILAVVNTQTGEIQLINTPRDYYVYLPDKNAYDKLTHAGLYGISCSIGALEYLYDIEIDYYVRINFTGFETLIDDIGGINLYVEEDFTSNDGVEFTAGLTHMDGETALIYARERKAFTDGDIQRGRNQMQVIEAIADKVLSGGSVLTHFSALLTDIVDMVQTNMSVSTIYNLVNYHLTNDVDWQVDSYTVTGTSIRRSTYSTSSSVYVMLQDESTIEEAKALIQAALNGETTDDEETEESD